MTTSHENLGSFTICPSCGKGLIIKAAGPGGAVKKEPLEVSDCCGEKVLKKERWDWDKEIKITSYVCIKCQKTCGFRTGLRVTNGDN